MNIRGAELAPPACPRHQLGPTLLEFVGDKLEEDQRVGRSKVFGLVVDEGHSSALIIERLRSGLGEVQCLVAVVVLAVGSLQSSSSNTSSGKYRNVPMEYVQTEKACGMEVT